MYKLHIKNFQSIKELTFPIQGFTAIVGDSNRGKSTILRALRTVLLNEWNSGFVKVGTKETQIEFEICQQSDYYKNILPDALDIKKIKIVKPLNEYQIFLSSGQILKYPKVGKNLPERMEGLNLSSITTERDDVFNLNFQTQFDSLFLISGTEVEITSFINKIFDISRFEKALREMKTDSIRLSKALEDNDNRKKALLLEQEILTKRKTDIENNIFYCDLRIKECEVVTKFVEEIKQDILTLQEIESKKVSLQLRQFFILVNKKYLSLLELIQEKTKLCFECKEAIQKQLLIFSAMKKLQDFITPAKYLLEKYSNLEKNCVFLEDLNKYKRNLTLQEKQKKLLLVYKLLFEKISILYSGVSFVQSFREEESMLQNLQDSLHTGKIQLSIFKKQLMAIEILKSNILESVQICPLCQQSICKEKII